MYRAGLLVNRLLRADSVDNFEQDRLPQPRFGRLHARVLLIHQAAEIRTLAATCCHNALGSALFNVFDAIARPDRYGIDTPVDLDRFDILYRFHQPLIAQVALFLRLWRTT